MKKNDIPVPVEATKMPVCPMEVYCDGDIHDAVANMRKLDRTIPVHPQYGVPRIFFAPKRARKYWTKASTLELGYFIHSFFALFQF
jgi:hypothetical protein